MVHAGVKALLAARFAMLPASLVLSALLDAPLVIGLADFTMLLALLRLRHLLFQERGVWQ
jgi:hypothetical protein